MRIWIIGPMMIQFSRATCMEDQMTKLGKMMGVSFGNNDSYVVQPFVQESFDKDNKGDNFYFYLIF